VDRSGWDKSDFDPPYLAWAGMRSKGLIFYPCMNAYAIWHRTATFHKVTRLGKISVGSTAPPHSGGDAKEHHCFGLAQRSLEVCAVMSALLAVPRMRGIVLVVSR